MLRISLYYGPVSVRTRNERDLVQPVVEIQTSILSGSILRADAVILAELLRVALKAEKEAASLSTLASGAS